MCESNKARVVFRGINFFDRLSSRFGNPRLARLTDSRFIVAEFIGGPFDPVIQEQPRVLLHDVARLECFVCALGSPIHLGTPLRLTVTSSALSRSFGHCVSADRFAETCLFCV